MEKQLIINIVKTIGFVIIGLILIYCLGRIVTPKWISAEDNRMGRIMQGFYKEPKNSLDVIFMGNSDVYRGISPITLWDEYGIASYNYVSSGQRMWTAYYMLIESLKYQHPQIILLNMDSGFNESKSSESNYRKVFDNMKFSKNKLNAITDPVFKIRKKEMINYIFPLFRYHSRWNELGKEDFEYAFKKEGFPYKGLDLITTIKPYEGGNSYMEKNNSLEKIRGNCLKYLEKIIETCKNNDIELILIELPSAESWTENLSNKTKEFANKHNLEFIDLNLKLDEMQFDWKTDSSDGGDHLNVYGAEKVSKYIGNMLIKNYKIPDRRNDSNYINWYNDSKIYKKDKLEMESI